MFIMLLLQPKVIFKGLYEGGGAVSYIVLESLLVAKPRD